MRVRSATRCSRPILNSCASCRTRSSWIPQSIAKKSGGLSKSLLETLAILISPFAPHIAEEIWELLGHAETVFAQKWPEADPVKLVADTVEIALQINGKLRGSTKIPQAADKDEAIALAKDALREKLPDSKIVKEIYVPGKIANFVVK